MPKQPPYEPVRPVSANRAGNARRYMGNMAKAANNGMLASETLVGLQRPSQGLPEGVPAMVLRRDSEGVWYAAEWSEPIAIEDVMDPDFTGGLEPTEYLDRLHAGTLGVTERNATVTPDRNAEPETVTPVTERNAPETMTNAERQKRHRDRKKAERERARERGE